MRSGHARSRSSSGFWPIEGRSRGRRRRDRRIGAASTLVVALLAAACSGRSQPIVPEADLLAPTTVTTEDVRGTRTATGAANGVRDPRLGAPGDGHPVEFVIEAGDCFNEGIVDGDQGPEPQVWITDCSAPHDAEAYATTEHPGVGRFLGEEPMADFATTFCLGGFAEFVGLEYPLSRFRIGIQRPTETTWSLGDRAIVCSVYDPDLEPLEGSVRGTVQ